MNDHPKIRLLLLEDNPQDVFLLEAMLESVGPADFQLVHVERLSRALSLLQQQLVDLVLADLNLPDSTGLDTVRALTRRAGQVPVVIMTGHNDPEVGSRILREGARSFFCKDHLSPRALSALVDDALGRKHVLSR
jgi:CheY-like chemotaxis protein